MQACNELVTTVKAKQFRYPKMQKYQSRSYRGGGGGGARGAAAPWTYWTRHIKSVDGSVFFRLSYFNYSDLQLFAIFIFEVDFSETYPMTSAENSVEHPQTTLQGSWLRHSR